MLKLIKLSIFIGLFAIVFAFTTNVMAMEDEVPTTGNEKTVTTTNSNKERIVQAQEKKEAMQVKTEERKNALSEARLRICETRQSTIQNRLTNLMNLGTSSHEAFEAHVKRVEMFYGDRLSEYDNGTNIATLRAYVDTNKEEVALALADVKANGGEFSCESDDPKGQFDAFRLGTKELIYSKKAYKNSIRSYVAAVRELAIKVKADKLSTTPEVTPNVTGSGVSEVE